jgi:hypothetical protein
MWVREYSGLGYGAKQSIPDVSKEFHSSEPLKIRTLRFFETSGIDYPAMQRGTSSATALWEFQLALSIFVTRKRVEVGESGVFIEVTTDIGGFKRPSVELA